MFCQNCGSQLPDGCRFCPECGTQVAVQSPEPEVQTAQPVSEPVPEVYAAPASEPVPEPYTAPVSEPAPEPYAAAAAAATARIRPEAQPQPQYTEPQPQYTEPQPQYTEPQPQYVQPEPAPAQPQKKSKKGLIIGLIIGGAVLLVAIIVALLLIVLPLIRNGKTVTVDFSQYAEVEFSGYENMGTAEAIFDEERFIADYGEKIQLSKKYKNMSDDPVRELLDYYIYYYLDDYYYDLKNGDEVVYDLYVDESVEEVFNVRIADSEKIQEDGYIQIPFTVSGLDETPAFDPFDGLKISYDGMEPYGKLELDWSDCPEPAYDCSYAFEADKEYDLSNGDVITISLYDEEFYKEYFVTFYGMTPSKTTMQFTVEGLPVLLTSLDDISSSDLADFEEVSNAIYQEDFVDSNDEQIATNSFEMIGLILKVSNDPSEYSYNNNSLYAVYEEKATVSAADGAVSSENYTLYSAIRFDNVSLEDGKLIFDPYDYDVEYHYFSLEVGAWTISGSYSYESLDELKNDLIDEDDRYYTYDSRFDL